MRMTKHTSVTFALFCRTTHCKPFSTL
uniref:Uncharacterized protein n=1 Tax=Anguilla anguilla TaxID=7936 RepID=A0A0E9QTD6_ANGAN